MGEKREKYLKRKDFLGRGKDFRGGERFLLVTEERGRFKEERYLGQRIVFKRRKKVFASLGRKKEQKNLLFSFIFYLYIQSVGVRTDQL